MASPRHREFWGFSAVFRNVSFLLSLIKTLLMIYFIFYWTFSIGGKYGLGTAQSSWSWTFESMSGSSTFHINLRRALLVHMPALGYQMLRGKRKSDYLAQVKVAIFILEIKQCNLPPFSDQRYFKRGQYKNRQNSQKSLEVLFRT